MKGPAPTVAPVTWCVLSAVLFGAATPASKSLLEFAAPVLLAGLLYAGAALAVAPFALRGIRAATNPDRKSVLRLLGAVFFGGIVGPVSLLAGLTIASAGSVALWLNLETVATAILARFFFREHLGPRTWVAVVLIVLASAMLSPWAAPGGWLAVLLVGLACLAWGLDNNLTSVIDRFSPAQVTFAKGTLAGAVNLSFGLALPGRALSPTTVAYGLAVGAVCYGISLLLYVASAQQLGATRSQLLFSTAPAWGLLLSWFALGEPIEATQLGAAALMGLAFWVWYREGHAHRHAHEAVTHRHAHRHDDGHHHHDHAFPVAPETWHTHEHSHEATIHEHSHRPDLHHRHEH